MAFDDCSVFGAYEPAFAEDTVSGYLSLQGGAPKCHANSNSDEIERGSERGWSVGLDGVCGCLCTTGSARIDLDLANSRNNLHGLNGNGMRQSADHMDDNVLNVTSGMVTDAPEVEVYGPISAFGVAGAGVARLAAFGDADWAFAYKFGAGLVGEISEPWSLRASYQWLRTASADINDYEAKGDLAGPVVALTYTFGTGSRAARERGDLRPDEGHVVRPGHRRDDRRGLACGAAGKGLSAEDCN